MGVGGIGVGETGVGGLGVLVAVGSLVRIAVEVE